MKTYKHLKILKDEIFTINLGLLELANIELWDKLVNLDNEISTDKLISTINSENELSINYNNNNKKLKDNEFIFNLDIYINNNFNTI